ncbi:MAG: hydrogenase 3 maturation endopeptidase HyCI [Chloroflexi bacterium]|nr:hydrogenase 3 maturation endopeptidase HyCI [Chloroflexota bacterium]
MGVGSDLRGDDSAGLMAVRALLEYKSIANAPHLLVLEGGPAPENHTGKIRAFQPELVLFIDAAHIGELPGTTQWIPLGDIDGMSASSHSLPLSMVANYLKLEIGCDVAVLGIQPEQNEVSGELSPLVHAAVDEIVTELLRALCSS